MHRNDHPTAAPGGEFTDGDPGQAIPASVLASRYQNTTHRELVNAVEGAGIALDTTDPSENDDQLLEAIQRLQTGADNPLANPSFAFWQRLPDGQNSFNFPNNPIPPYGPDHWYCFTGGNPGAATVSRFQPTGAEFPGVSRYVCRWNQTTGSASIAPWLEQQMPDLHKFAGEHVVLSGWFRVSSGTLLVVPRFSQRPGNGGGAAVDTNGTAITVTTTWQRLESEIQVPSLNGLAIGGVDRHSAVAWVFPTGATFTLECTNLQVRPSHFPSMDFWMPPKWLDYAHCQQYYQRSRNFSQADFITTGPGSVSARHDGSFGYGLNQSFRVEMARAPDITWWSPQTGLANNIRVGGVDQLVIATLETNAAQTGYPEIQNVVGNSTWRAHYIADAEFF